MSDQTAIQRARIDVVRAAHAILGAVLFGAASDEAIAADHALDLAAIRLVAELEARQVR
jgi:hypothetical protein